MKFSIDRRRFVNRKRQDLENSEGALEDISKDTCSSQIGRFMTWKASEKSVREKVESDTYKPKPRYEVVEKVFRYVKEILEWFLVIYRFLKEFDLLLIQKPSKE